MKKAQYAYFLIPYIVPYLVGKVQKEPYNARVISQNLESPPYNTKEYYMGDFLCTYVLNRIKLTFNSIFNV